jgi:Cu(I)/Ag(I) efflux system membrane fusion protein
MKALIVVVLIAVAAVGGWFFGRGKSTPSAEPGGRKIAFYQSPMHPWIKSDKPGNCTICGMKLTPVFEGEKGFETDANVITLTSNAINVVNVQTEPVQVRPIERTLTVAGKIETDETRLRVISAYVDGRIDKLFVNFVGDKVEAGEPLALIYSPSLLTAEREYLTLLSQTNFTGSPVLGAQHDRLIEGARQRLRRLGLSNEQIAQLRPDAATNFTTQVSAPIGGTVVTRAVVEGQYVKEGDKLFEIADLSQMWFRFEVYEQDLPFIKVGDVVRVSSPALGTRTYEGPITFIDPNINQETRSARVRVELQNPAIEQNGRPRRDLFNGLYAEGRIALKTDPVLAVSRSAVMQPGDGARVYVDQGGGAYEHRPVKIGRQGEEFIEILEGLNEGDRVVSSGNLLLDSQAQINRTSSSSPEGSKPAAPHDHDHGATATPTAPAASAESTPGTSKAASTTVAEKLTEKQAGALKEFLDFVAGLNEQLAADNLNGYNERLSAMAKAVTALSESFADAPAFKDPVAKVVTESQKLKPGANLASARAAHNPFSKAIADLYRAARPVAPEIAVKIYRCPMYPKPGQSAFWVQAREPLRNPFFGSEMLECGVEVK